MAYTLNESYSGNIIDSFESIPDCLKARAKRFRKLVRSKNREIEKRLGTFITDTATGNRITELERLTGELKLLRSTA